MYKPFLVLKAFFLLDSRKLDIHVVEHVSDILHVINVKSIKVCLAVISSHGSACHSYSLIYPNVALSD